MPVSVTINSKTILRVLSMFVLALAAHRSIDRAAVRTNVFDVTFRVMMDGVDVDVELLMLGPQKILRTCCTPAWDVSTLRYHSSPL